MSSNTPTASPTVHVNHWSENQVSDWLASLGLAKFAKEFRSNGITGDVLVLLDDDALRDIGVSTIGQRLSVLSAIYRLKQQFGIPIQEGDWVPKSGEAQDHFPGAASSPHLVSLLRQRDDRIRTLEGQIFRLADYLSRFQQDFASVCKHVGVKTLSSEMPISVVSVGSRSANEARGHSHSSSDSSAHSFSAFGSQSELASSTSSHAVDSPTARNFPGIASPSRPSFGTSFAAAAHSRTAGSTSASGLGANPSASHNGDEGPGSGPNAHGPSSSHSAASLSGTATGFKSTTMASLRNDGGYGAPSSFNAAGHTNATTIGGGIHASTSLPSLAAAGAELSPTHSTPSATPTAATPASAGPSLVGMASSMQSPTRRAAPTSPSNGLTKSSSGTALSTVRNASPSQPISTATGSLASAATAPSAQTSEASSRTDTSTTATTPTSAALTKNAGGSGSGSDSTDSHPYKSFRVTLDDPCHKVLPAALKKYKIVDDWRLYALFICYGKTERCLSYDEKPLLLFQKLKENKQSPVFMLRHIKDVKSPIAIANEKAQAKKLSAGAAVAGPSSSSSSSSSSAAKASATAARNDRRRLMQGSPPVGANISHLSMPVETGPAAELPPSSKASRTYAVAIYPYVPERNDEFVVGVGDVFVVLNKAKGWWVVQKDSKGDGTGDVVYSVPAVDGDDTIEGGPYRAEISSGWVPAGCLLETSRPLSRIVGTQPGGGPGAGLRARSGSLSNSGPNTPTAATTAAAAAAAAAAASPITASLPNDAGNPANARAAIPPAYITSTSTLGVMLMDYRSPDDALDLRKDARLRVFKRYNHWSYCVQEGDGHARGWVPSWFIGKVSTGGGGGSGSSATTPREGKAAAGGSGTTISPTALLGAAAAVGGSASAGEGRSQPGQGGGNGAGETAVSPGKVNGTGEGGTIAAAAGSLPEDG